MLAEIFDLPAALDVSQPNHKVEELRLDFHYINYTFCKEHQFSNEKISTLLAIMEHVLGLMLEKSLSSEQGFATFRQLLEDHGKQRPPYSILIFSAEEIQKIQEFAIDSLFRHYSLYEFAFKPRVELILRTAPVINYKFNAALPSLDSMVEVDPEEADRLKAFLGNTEAEVGDNAHSEIHTNSARQASQRSQAQASQRSQDGRASQPSQLRTADEVSATGDRATAT